MIIGSLHLQAQGTLENKWQEHYWKTRANLVNYFMVVGNDEGNSIPFQRYVTGIRPCENSNQVYKGQIRLGDGTTRLGQYIAVLATEYELLNRSGQNTERTLTELYFALEAFERLDQFAEYYNSGKSDIWDPNTNGSTINGYFLRDDIPFDLWKEYDGKPENLFRQENDHPDPLLAKRYVDSDLNKECDPSGSTANYPNLTNTPSQDQLIYMFIGFALIRKFNIDVDHSPSPGYPSLNILDKAVELTHNVMRTFVSLQYYAHIDNPTLNQSFDYYTNWTIVDPTTGKLPIYQTGPAGMEWFLNAYGIGKAANYITGTDNYSVDYRVGFNRHSGILSDEFYLILGFDNPDHTLKNIAATQLIDCFQATTDEKYSIWEESLEFEISRLTLVESIVNKLILWRPPFEEPYTLFDIWMYQRDYEDQIYKLSQNKGSRHVNMRMYLALNAIMGDEAVGRHYLHSKGAEMGYAIYGLLFDVINEPANRTESYFQPVVLLTIDCVFDAV